MSCSLSRSCISLSVSRRVILLLTERRLEAPLLALSDLDRFSTWSSETVVMEENLGWLTKVWELLWLGLITKFCLLVLGCCRWSAWLDWPAIWCSSRVSCRFAKKRSGFLTSCECSSRKWTLISGLDRSSCISSFHSSLLLSSFVTRSRSFSCKLLSALALDWCRAGFDLELCFGGLLSARVWSLATRSRLPLWPFVFLVPVSLYEKGLTFKRI